LINLRSVLKSETIDTSREAVLKTGYAFLVVGCFIGIIIFLIKSYSGGWTEWNWYQGLENHVWRWFIGVGIAMYVGSWLAYPVLKPIHIGWMTLAIFLAWLSSGLLLTVYFYIVIMPIGLLMRLFGKDLLDMKTDSDAKSYWIKREQKPFNKRDYERLF